MPVRFLCPTCHQLLSIATRKIGKEVDCPKCGSTILVPDPNERPSREGPSPFEQLGLEHALSEISGGEQSSPESAPPSNSLPATPLLQERDKKPPVDDSLIVISRRVLYLQAALLAIVAVVAFLCGYLIGSGGR